MLGVLAVDRSMLRGVPVGRSSVGERSGVRVTSGRLRSDPERSRHRLEGPVRGSKLLEGRWVVEGEKVERGSERTTGDSDRGENERKSGPPIEGELRPDEPRGAVTLGR